MQCVNAYCAGINIQQAPAAQNSTAKGCKKLPPHGSFDHSAITDFNHHRFQPLNLTHRICAVDRDETVESNFLKLHILFCERVPKMLNLTIYISSPNSC